MGKTISIFIGALFVLLLLFCIGGAQVKETYLYVEVEKENLRDVPKGSKIAEVFQATEMKSLEEKGEWVKVEITGWIWKPSTTPDKDKITKLKAKRKEEKGSWTLSKKEEDRIIKEHCTREWPDDFAMRAYCEKKQREGLATLKLGKPNDISEEDFQVIRSKCAREWPDDFAMRAYCEKKQFEAIRELRR